LNPFHALNSLFVVARKDKDEDDSNDEADDVLCVDSDDDAGDDRIDDDDESAGNNRIDDDDSASDDDGADDDDECAGEDDTDGDDDGGSAVSASGDTDVDSGMAFSESSDGREQTQSKKRRTDTYTTDEFQKPKYVVYFLLEMIVCSSHRLSM